MVPKTVFLDNFCQIYLALLILISVIYDHFAFFVLYRSSRRGVLYGTGVLKNVAIFTGKHLF